MVTFKRGCALLYGEYISIEASKGAIMNEDDSDATKMKLATGEFLGILTVAVVENSTANKNDRYIKGQTGIFEEQALAGERATLRGGEGEIETDQVATGSDTGAISDSTAQDTELSVSAGKWREVQGGDTVKGRLLGPGSVSGRYLIEIF